MVPEESWFGLTRLQRLIIAVCLPCYLLMITGLHMAGWNSYLVVFIATVLGLLFCYLVVASKVLLAHQLRTLTNLIEAMTVGDYSLRGRVSGDRAMSELLSQVNLLAESLSHHKAMAVESRLLLDKFIDQMDAMVLVLDEHERVIMANQPAQAVLLTQKPSAEHPLKLTSSKLGQQLMACEGKIVTLDDGQLSGEYLVLRERFISDGKTHQFLIISNAERLLMEKERTAWQGLLRVLSHEVNNSLTPISTIAQQLNKRLAQQDNLPSAQSLRQGVGIISERASSLSTFLEGYTRLTHLPQPNKSPLKLGFVTQTLEALYPEIHWRFAVDESATVMADKQQFEQILLNLTKNAQEAVSSEQHPEITFSSSTQMNQLVLTMVDNGTGISNPENVFVPFYTTKAQGSGIGLALCRQIMFSHGGSIKLDNNPDGPGARVRLFFPYYEH
ncbi:ATP-binding protein [Pseudoalteromonas sp. R3]|uniref:sensor histidine kinase n=1 Tax=Pseudoalteromonas sp. R3 TaxID=1709477 RepID=UPI0006B68BF4|nr:ATP-binding protein [Pseudoalteromonas sp. R3]AZZ96207.1 GHKL domain-containing protein [Pseudoalteromonas sp. R3]